MTQRINVGITSALYELSGPTHATAAEALLDDASLLHMPGRSGLAGQYQGQEAILGLLERMTQLTNGSLRYTPSHVITANDRAIVLSGHASATRQGTRLDTDEMRILSLQDGIIQEIWIFHKDQNHVDEFWTAHS